MKNSGNIGIRAAWSTRAEGLAAFLKPALLLMKNPWFLLALGVVVVFTMSSCGSAATTVTLKDLSFQPDVVTIKKGDSVIWKNEDRRIRQIMSGAPPMMTDDFMSPEIDAGESWSHTFDEAGEFPYHDMNIPNQLGRVIVKD